MDGCIRKDNFIQAANNFHEKRAELCTEREQYPGEKKGASTPNRNYVART